MAGILTTLLSLSGCGKAPKDEQVVVRGQSYILSSQNKSVVSSVGDQIYVRFEHKFQDSEIMIIYDPRNYDLNVDIGAPNLLGVVGESKVEILNQLKKLNIGSEIVFCNRRLFGKNHHFTCGMRIENNGVSWSVNFDENLIELAPLIRIEANKVLKSYGEAANAK